MALIEFNPEFKALVFQLKRIADALELWLDGCYGLKVDPKKSDTADDELDVSYATDLGSLKREMKDVHHGKNPDRTIDTDEDDA